MHGNDEEKMSMVLKNEMPKVVLKGNKDDISDKNKI